MLLSIISMLMGCTIQYAYRQPPVVEPAHIVYHHEVPQYYAYQRWVPGYYDRNGYWVSGYWATYDTAPMVRFYNPPPAVRHEHRQHRPHRHRR